MLTVYTMPNFCNYASVTWSCSISVDLRWLCWVYTLSRDSLTTTTPKRNTHTHTPVNYLKHQMGTEHQTVSR